MVDLLDGGPKANPKPTLANGVPTVITSQVPSELIVFNGQPDFVPINGTQLLWASNTTSDVFVNTVSSDYFVPARRPLVHFDEPERAVELRRQQRAAAGLRAHPARLARRRPCCPRSPARRRRRKR